MRNFNTSFVKNAIRFFANEASQVLRALIDPATILLRLIQSIARTVLVVVTPYRYRQMRLQPVFLTAGVTPGMSETNDRMNSVVAGKDQVGEHGIGRWDCHLGLTVS